MKKKIKENQEKGESREEEVEIRRKGGKRKEKGRKRWVKKVKKWGIKGKRDTCSLCFLSSFLWARATYIGLSFTIFPFISVTWTKGPQEENKGKREKLRGKKGTFSLSSPG